MPAETPVESGPRFKISHKIALTLCVLVLLILTAFWLLARDQLQQTLQLQSDSLGDTLAQQTADSVTELVLAGDQLSLNVVLNQLARNPHILSVAIYDVDGGLLASSGRLVPETSTAGIINASYTAQISLQDSIAGTVRLNLDITGIERNLQRTFRYFWFILGLGLVLAVTASHALGHHLTSPLLNLLEALQHPADAKIQIDPGRSDEIAQLQRAADELMPQLSQEAAYLSPEPGENAMDLPLRRQASVLVITVTDMNTVIELLHPRTLDELLNEFYLIIQQAGRLYGGHIQHLSGAAVLLTFEAQHASGDFAFNAVCCAQLFLKLIQKIKRRHHAEGAQSLDFRLGIHTGDIFIFSPSEGGSRPELILGKTTAISRHLSELSRPAQVLISEATFLHAGAEERLHTRNSVEITLPPDNTASIAYILNDDNTSAYQELLERQARHILARYQDRGPDSFAEADSDDRPDRASGHPPNKTDLNENQH
ncbi:MAG: AhpA/YtjB family protein [Pseudomonadales bacterium]|nr:AhpA/YtjB family protein [Pseudomonadales bacterium]